VPTLREQPVTLRAALRDAVAQFKRAGLAYGHGTHNARDEAVYLILHTLKLPLGELDAVLDRRLSAGELDALRAILRRRVRERAPRPTSRAKPGWAISDSMSTNAPSCRAPSSPNCCATLLRPGSPTRGACAACSTCAPARAVLRYSPRTPFPRRA